MTDLLERIIEAAELPEQIASDARKFGLPSARTENWRYSSLKPLEKLVFTRRLKPASAVDPSAWGLLTSRGTPTEVWTGGTPAIGSQSPAPVAAAPYQGSSVFAQLATHAAGARGELGLKNYLVFGTSADNQYWSCGNELSLASGAQAELSLHHLDMGGTASLGNVLTRISVGSGAQLTLIRVQEANFSAHLIERTEIVLGAGARLRVLLVDLGSAWYRHELDVRFLGAGAHAEVFGLAALRGRQHGDSQLNFAHQVGKCVSQTRFKSIADGRSRSIFNGRIAVAPGADGSDAELNTGNLLLSPFAEIDAKPELEIYADEVRCKHGATVGQLDETGLFYLRSRGIGLEQARQMLTFAFCREVLDGLGDTALSDELAVRLRAHLPSVAEMDRE